MMDYFILSDASLTPIVYFLILKRFRSATNTDVCLVRDF